MLWCLAEGIAQLDRIALKNASVICLLRDERKGRLMIRFRCTGDDLAVRTGMMYQCKDFGTGGKCITDATNDAFRKISTWGHSAPPRYDGTPVKVRYDRSCDGMIRQKVLALGVDAAADELLSGRMMKGSTRDEMLPITPGLRLVMRDKTHGCRRVLQRPQSADAFLKDVHDNFVASSESIAQKIHNSHVFRSLFEKCVQKQTREDIPSGVNIKALKAAKHRHESFTTPHCRIVIHIDAVLATAVQISISRQAKSEGTAALKFLDWVDEEKYLTLAMLGDASDEGLSLLRFTDSERMDTAEAQEEVQGYEERMNALFLQFQCQHVDSIPSRSHVCS